MHPLATIKEAIHRHYLTARLLHSEQALWSPLDPFRLLQSVIFLRNASIVKGLALRTGKALAPSRGLQILLPGICHYQISTTGNILALGQDQLWVQYPA